MKALEIIDGKYKCNTCKEILPIENFYRDSHYKCGYHPKCKECSKIYHKLHRSKFPPEEYKKIRLEQHRAWRERNPNYVKEYYQKNRDKFKISAAAFNLTPKGKYRGYKNKNATARGFEFSLTMEEFMTFWQKDCHYCGDKVSTIGIDRKDSSIGYVMENLVPCCAMCNRMKMEYPYEDFVNKCKLIANRL